MTMPSKDAIRKFVMRIDNLDHKQLPQQCITGRLTSFIEDQETTAVLEWLREISDAPKLF
jgi:hypothetical protein